MSTTFARDYHMHGEIAATRDGTILALRARVLADHGAFNAHRPADQVPGRVLPHLHRLLRPAGRVLPGHRRCTPTRRRAGSPTRARSGSPRRCTWSSGWWTCWPGSWAWTRPSCGCATCCGPSSSPTPCPTGWEYDSGDYPRALRLALDIAGYEELRREQAERRERGEYMGIGLSFFTEGVGAGPRKHMDILGLGMADGADLRVYPTGKAVLAISVQTQGQGHETTFAQIVAAELGLSPDDVEVVHGDTDRTPFGLGTYGSRSTPVSGAAAVDGGPQGARAGQDRRGGHDGGVRRRPGMGGRPVAGARRPGAGPRHRRDRDGGALARSSCPRGCEGHLDADDGLQPAEPDVPVRGLHLRDRRRPRHRRGARYGGSSRWTTAGCGSTP